MPVERRSLRTVPFCALFLFALLAPPSALYAESFSAKAGKWCLEQITSWVVGKGLDFVAAQVLRQEGTQEVRRTVQEMSAAFGPRRAVLQEKLEVDREQLALLTRLIDSKGKAIQAIQADQKRLLERARSLETRMGKLERKVGEIDAHVAELDARVRRLEDALIHECLDLKNAPIFGADEYRVKESRGGWADDHFESDELTLDARLLLDSCTGDLTRRGLLLQLSLVTRGLTEDLRLYATWKGIESGGRGGNLSRQEIPLDRPAYDIDGQVVELFFPYDEIPDFSYPDKLALALVLTHDGEVLYSLPDRVISCVFGQRVNCRWGR